MAATDMPEEGELVLATVKKIMPYGAFCTLDEYGNREAFVHISEVAPRWIKNIHEFLHEGQHLVAKVFKLVAEKNQIDLTLKGVSESEKKAKMEDSRRTRRSDKLFEVALKIAKSTKSEELVARAALAAKFGGIGEAFEALGEQGESALVGVKQEREKGSGRNHLDPFTHILLVKRRGGREKNPLFRKRAGRHAADPSLSWSAALPDKGGGRGLQAC